MMSAPKTILYVAKAPFFSGAEHALLRLVERLDRTRYVPVVVVGAAGVLEDELRRREIETVRVPLVRSEPRTAGRWFASVTRLAWLIRRHRAALVHANDLQSFHPAGYAARLCGVPAWCHVRYYDTKAGFEWFLRPGVDRVLFISEHIRTQSVQQCGALLDGRHDVIYDGVVVPDAARVEPRHDLRSRLGLPPGVPAVVLAGQVAANKGLWEFIDAAGVLAGRGLAVQFVVVGDDLRTGGSVRREAEDRVAHLGLSHRVKFSGFVRNVQDLLPAFDIAAVPSHAEPLGLAALEGMAAGLPVVASRVGGLTETVVGGETGLLVPPGNAAALADALALLAGQPEMAAMFGARGRQRVLECFSIETHVERMLSLYDETLGGRGRPAS